MKSASKSRWHSSCRLRLEYLEDRLQPSGLQPGVLQHAAAAFPLTPRAEVGAVSRPVGQDTGGVRPPAAIDYATYVTGTRGTATGRGVAVDAFDSQYVTGFLDDGMTRSAYLRKYLANGAPDAAFPFVAFRVTVNGNFLDTQGHGIAVDPATGNVEVVGAAVDPANGNQVAFLAQFDSAGTLFNIMGYGIDPNPNSFDSVAVDAAGDVVFIGTLSVPALGHSDLTVGAIPAGGAPLILPYDVPMTAGSTGLGIAVDPAGMTAYVAGSAVATPGGPQEGLFGWIDRNNPAALHYLLLPSPAGDVVVNAVAVNAAGPYFAVTTPGGAAVVRMDAAVTTVLNEFDFIADPTVTVAALGLDAAGNVDVTGQSLNAATGNLTAQLTQLDGNLNLVSTVQVGGTGTDAGLALAVKSTGSVVVAGTTDSADLPVTDGTTLNGTTDAFLLSYTFPC
jgi:hypothetical protein